jgi:hypothetical protein
MRFAYPAYKHFLETWYRFCKRLSGEARCQVVVRKTRCSALPEALETRFSAKYRGIRAPK